MFKKILVPVDGSENSFKAVKTAASIVEKYNCSITLMHVIELPAINARPEFNEVLKQLKDEIEIEGQKIIDIAKSYIHSSNVNSIIVFGQPASKIITELNNNYDLIVLGSRGFGEFKGIMLGSVSDKVSHHSKSTVMIVH